MPAKKNTMTEEERSRSFIETARKLGCDETGETFEKAFAKIVPPKRSTAAAPEPKPGKRHP
jgi:hypothetical protein